MTDLHTAAKQEPVAYWRYALVVEGQEVNEAFTTVNWDAKFEPFGRRGIDHGGEVTKQPLYTRPQAREPEQPAQEPVAWGVFEGNLHDMFFTEAEAVEMAQLKGTHAEVKPLYTRHQAREPLTDEQIHDIYDEVARREPYNMAVTRRNIARAIEAAHGIKGGA